MVGMFNIIIVDIGGILVDILIIFGGQLKIMNQCDIYVLGYLVLMLMIDLVIIGVGGGLVVFIDDVGGFNVGLCLVGFELGLVCYGCGGDELIVIDVQIVLGCFDFDMVFGGDLWLDVDLVCKVVEEKIVWFLGLLVNDVVLGIIRIINNNMVLVIWLNLVVCGIDFWEFFIMLFGGVGLLYGVVLVEVVSVCDVVVLVVLGIIVVVGLLKIDL